jgi:hypothetical protein
MFVVYRCTTKDDENWAPLDAPPVWRYAAKDALQSPGVPAVEVFRKLVADSEKQLAKTPQSYSLTPPGRVAPNLRQAKLSHASDQCITAELHRAARMNDRLLETDSPKCLQSLVFGNFPCIGRSRVEVVSIPVLGNSRQLAKSHLSGKPTSM